MKARRFFNPTASWKRWGFFVLVAAVFLTFSGCSTGTVNVCSVPVVMEYDAVADSLGVDEFLALTATQQKMRRRAAARYLNSAQKAGRIDLEIRAMTNAAGLTPDDPEIWLTLARRWDGVGNYLQTDIALDNAATAVRLIADNSPILIERGSVHKNAMGLATALQRAWLHYQRGEWREAMPWVRTAAQVEHSNEAVRQIRGILEAIQGNNGMAQQIAHDIQNKNRESADALWIMSNLDVSRGNFREAYNYFTSSQDGQGGFVALRPESRRASECYRDMGRVAERVGDLMHARKWYKESAAALPFREISCLTEISFQRVGDKTARSRLPFWIAFDQYYVTGSLSSYLAYAYDRFENASEGEERNRWGGLVVNAAGIMLRLELEKPDTRRLRGLVFAGTDRPGRALNDLKLAKKEFAEEGRPTAVLAGEIGHLLMLQQDHGPAIGFLREAVAGEPGLARAWSDLGLAMIMAGDQVAATAALTRAIDLDDSLAVAWYNRGLMYVHEGDWERAESDLVRAAGLAPENMEIAQLLQQVMRQKKNR